MGNLSKILHVEDEEVLREITKMSLELFDTFEVLQAPLGNDALDIVRGFGPDLLLLDVQMPGLTGPETLQAIRAMDGYENIPAIYLTAKVIEANKGELEGPNVLGVIPKPFDPTTLAQQIRTLWNNAGSEAA